MNEEHPILFSTPMVQAILDDRKTMTRRVVKVHKSWLHPSFDGSYGKESGIATFKRKPYADAERDQFHATTCPQGQVGDHLWVRETFFIDDVDSFPFYKASEEHPEIFKWKPSIFMPRWASRITLEVTNIRVERLQEITEEDAVKEGIQKHEGWYKTNYRQPNAKSYLDGYTWTGQESFKKLWDSINGKKYPWSSNPWVWVVEFKRI